MLINRKHNLREQISYAGGLTKPMIADIRNTDVSKVQHYFAQNNINADFQDNKFLAWATAKVFDIIKALQQNFNLKPGLPNNILVKDTNALCIPNLESTYGFCNLVPCKIHKGSDEVTPAKSIIFNKNFPWHKIDEISDFDFHDAKNTTTDFFLESIIHEFGHIFHENNLLKKFSIKEVLKKLLAMTDPANIQTYQQRYGQLVADNLCQYATKEPLDLIDCDMSKRVIPNLDRENLTPVNNPFINSPYENLFALKRLFRNTDEIDLLIKQIYDGKTEILNAN